MKLTRKQFDILETLAMNDGLLPQRQLKEITSYSLGTINKTMKELNELELVKSGKISDKGFNALEPYRAKRASLLLQALAAGWC